MIALRKHPRDGHASVLRRKVMHLERLIGDRSGPTIEIHTVLQRRDQTVRPLVICELALLEFRRRTLRQEHMARRNLFAITRLQIGVFDDQTFAVALQRSKQRAGPDIRTFICSELADCPVQLFARRRMTGSEEDFVFAKVDVEERKARGIAMHDGARHIERLAKTRTQAGGAHAFCTDDAVFVQHDRLNSGPRRFSRSRAARGSAADDEKFDFLEHGWDASTRGGKLAFRVTLNAMNPSLTPCLSLF